MPDFAQEELEHRRSVWAKLQERGGPKGVAPAILRELGIYGGAQGVWVDKARTSKLTPDGSGITVGLLHTGSSYADDLSEDGVLYHYPKTNRPPGRDAAEVAATKAAGRLGLPVFVISYPTPASTKRNVDLAWVEGWDDKGGLFLVSFATEPPPLLHEAQEDTEPFALFAEPHTALAQVAVRRGQQRFKFRVFQRYGPACAVCGQSVLDLLDAAHIGTKKDRGSDDPRNGLVLCANHHRAFDAGLFAVKPQALEICCKTDGPGAAALQISFPSLAYLARKPHEDAVAWRWEQWKSASGATSHADSETAVQSDD